MWSALICMPMPAPPKVPNQRTRDRRHDHRVDDELAERAALGDLGEERAAERPPGDPPAPVEDSPAGEPLLARTEAVGRAGRGAILGHAAGGRGSLPRVVRVEPRPRVALPGDLGEVPEVVAEGCHHRVEDVHRVVHEEHRRDQEHAHGERDVREHGNAALETHGHRARGDERHQDHDRALRLDVVVDAGPARGTGSNRFFRRRSSFARRCRPTSSRTPCRSSRRPCTCRGRRTRPMLSWRTPRPSDVQTPKSVQQTETMSTTSPRQPWICLPQSG